MLKPACALLGLIAVAVVAPALAAEADPLVARGRYLVMIGGCNDCHTAAFTLSGAKVPEREWLKGDTLGFRGPWGTTYPSNLRAYMQLLTETQWVKLAKNLQTRPPMPYWALNAMTEADLRALYRFVRQLGAPGDAAPEYLPPDKAPQPPYFELVLPSSGKQ